MVHTQGVKYPQIIQGGMGVAISSWPLAQAVAKQGQLGVVSGTALDAILARRLQLGDLGGHMAEALSHFPIKEMAERVWDRYFISGGKAPTAPFKSKPIFSLKPTTALVELLIVANFVEVWLAKQGHNGLVGINLLEKIQLPTLPSLYGAMLAGVDVVLMGAGIPRAIPGILDKFAACEKAEMRIDVAGGEASMTFDPARYGFTESLPRPQFFGIVASASLAQILAKKCNPGADGFIVEGPTAGGHNAPPRGNLTLNDRGEPIYGERDLVDFEKFRELALPFWLAGSYGTHEKLQEALSLGAQGIQVGTAFAFCEESGLRPDLKAEVIRRCLANEVRVFTDPKASPTGFPFKVVGLPGSVSEESVVAERTRVCDLGYLRETYHTPEGKIGYRCPAEPVEDYVRKGGDLAACEGRVCVCNGLMATAGFPQIHKGAVEAPLVTAGDDLAHISRYLRPGSKTYSARDVIEALLGHRELDLTLATSLAPERVPAR